MGASAEHRAESEHLVQFYEGDRFLADAAVRFVGPGLQAGHGGVLIATRPHLERIEGCLRARGLDLGAAREQGRYVTLDAVETLSRLMDGDWPDEARFAELVGGVIASAAGGALPVRVFGELVALLRARGTPRATVRLEALWNDLARVWPFSLLCAYPIRSFGRAEDAPALLEICAEHSQVLPAESYAEIPTDDERLRVVTRLQQKAAAIETEIEDRKRIEARLVEALAREQEARASAERASRGKDDFLATLSHELRTPLTAMLGWLRLLRGGQLDPAQTRYALDVLERNGQAQARLIDDLLDVSAIMAGRLGLDVGQVDLAAVIRSVVETMRPAADAKGIALEATLDPSVAAVPGDPGRVQQIVWNLLSNAVKYTPAGGHIEVELARGESTVRIAVKDTGIGIRSDFLPRLFQRFSQAQDRPSGSRRGVGLGLAIVRHLVELHGGRVEAASAGEGRGATFTVSLPAGELGRGEGGT